LNGDGFGQIGGQQIGVAVVGAPFVGHAIDGAVGVAHQQAGFQAQQRGGIALIGCNSKVLTNTVPAGKDQVLVGA
jgi:hypothetical protein